MNPAHPMSSKKGMSSSCIAGPAGIEISKNVLVTSSSPCGRLVLGGLAVDHVEENLPYSLQAFLTAFVGRILRRMPEAVAGIGIVEIDQINGLYAGLVQREMVVKDGALHLIGKLVNSKVLRGGP